MSFNFIDTAFFDSIYGDGSTGDATVTGIDTMTSDRYYNNLTITATGILNPNNYRIFVKEKLEIQAGGFIAYNGANAAGAAQGPARSLAGTFRFFGRRGSAGIVAGGANLVGNGADFPITSQPSIAAATSINGWSGGAGGSATLAGGAANAGSINQSAGTFKSLICLTKSGWLGGGAGGFLTTEIGAGPGGAGGACDAGTGTDFSGGGGGGAPGVAIFAKEIVNNGTIQSKGGTGGNASHATAKAGGGGGGAGGIILTVCRFPTKLGTRDVSGGAGGTGAGGGGNGLTGDTGLIIALNC